LLLASAYWTLWCLDGSDDSALAPALPWLHAASAWMLTLLLAWEASWQIGQYIQGVWPTLPSGAIPALGLAWLSRSRLAPAWPVARHQHTYRVFASIPVGVFCALWVLAINLGSDGDPRELPYVPLLNPLDIAVALVLASLARYWFALRPDWRRQLGPDYARILPGIAVALVFLWLNAALIRALHYALGSPLDGNGILNSITIQAALSIFWGLTGLASMVIAARRVNRDAWMAGAALMGVLVAKLFLLDTAGRGTLARIVSFLVVGALLLVAGYLSPLPPRQSGERAAVP
jgi:uncharacterized membrane protein